MAKIALPKIICVVGPTASGKSAVGIELARQFKGDVISADSRMVYSGMEIGTATPQGQRESGPHNKPVLRASDVIHYCIGIVEPNQEYSVINWKQEAIEAIKVITSLNRVPVVVGGTGFYIKVLVDNLIPPSVRGGKQLRDELDEKIKIHGLEMMVQRLLTLDPGASQIVDLLNPVRVIRALEVCILTQKPYSQQISKGLPIVEALQIGLMVEKEELDRRIRERIEEQFSGGLVEEVKELISRHGYQIGPLTGFVYKETWDYIEGRLTLVEAKEQIALRTRQYAKRQLTWFKKDKRIHWIKKPEEAFPLAAQFLKSI